jgi:hypothetical protein
MGLAQFTQPINISSNPCSGYGFTFQYGIRLGFSHPPPSQPPAPNRRRLSLPAASRRLSPSPLPSAARAAGAAPRPCLRPPAPGRPPPGPPLPEPRPRHCSSRAPGPPLDHRQVRHSRHRSARATAPGAAAPEAAAPVVSLWPFVPLPHAPDGPPLRCRPPSPPCDASKRLEVARCPKAASCPLGRRSLLPALQPPAAQSLGLGTLRRSALQPPTPTLRCSACRLVPPRRRPARTHGCRLSLLPAWPHICASSCLLVTCEQLIPLPHHSPFTSPLSHGFTPFRRAHRACPPPRWSVCPGHLRGLRSRHEPCPP